MFRDLSDEARRTTQRSEIAAPMPFDAPVTTATLPFKLLIAIPPCRASLHHG
jgi:hypothetical protein